MIEGLSGNFANADMRPAALTDVLREDAGVKRIYLMGQDYSVGQQVGKRALAMRAAKRPARKAGFDERSYTFYGNARDAPAAIGEAGVDRVLAVAEWHLNVGTAASERFYASFRERFPRPQDDYVHARMHVMVEKLAHAIEQARSTDAIAVAKALEGMPLASGTRGGFPEGWMRAAHHQFIQPLYVSLMQRAGTRGTVHDNEGSGFGFRTVRYFEPRATELPNRCQMQRP